MTPLLRYSPLLLLPLLGIGGYFFYRSWQDDRLMELREIWLADSLGCGRRSVETTKEMLEGFGVEGRSPGSIVKMLGPPTTQFVDMSDSERPVRRLIYTVVGECAGDRTRIESADTGDPICLLEIAIDFERRTALGYQIRCE